MEESFTCPICFNECNDKYMTKCGHIFCCACMMYLYNKHDGVFSCPICREHLYIQKSKISIPPFDPKNYPLESGLDIPELLSAYNTITRENKWEMLHDYIVDEIEGFMFTNNKVISGLMHKINDDYSGCHSGYSMAFTMRAMHYIAKFGLQTYKRYIEMINLEKK